MGHAVEEALAELETLGDEIRVKLHLAEMDARTVWTKTLEPRLFEARKHAQMATTASKEAVVDTIKAFKDFSATL
jgi:hypothetical protein